ncbi:ribbon-helix-helix domain-containing protein [Amycolatopsis panacis]|uniref:hypothetical protein n=1 Tax=Amycolatopsis panacis TaxID=2340917 RepID=UPI001F46DEE5|nr:hypothetical protein [Amycolatopsis panacis]
MTQGTVDEQTGNDDLKSQNDSTKPAPSAKGGGGGLERVTVNLAPRASRALENAVKLTGDSKTDTINRALQVYAYLEEVWDNQGEVLIRSKPDSTELIALKFF